jgi:AcrR family transcriptional regulator
VNAGLAVVDEVGVEALTIRNVAKRAGAPAMTLYTHFDTKEELLDLMYTEVSRRLYADNGNATWQAELKALCHQIRGVIVEHPHWTPLLVRVAPPLDIPIRERLLAMMIADGIPPGKALEGLTAAMVLTYGLTLVELRLRTPDGHSTIGKRLEQLKEWVASEPRPNFPAQRAAFAAFSHFDLHENLEYSILTLIRGLEAQQAEAEAENETDRHTTPDSGPGRREAARALESDHAD